MAPNAKQLTTIASALVLAMTAVTIAEPDPPARPGADSRPTTEWLTEPVFIFSQGDEYLVYPGATGPMSSIRWEQLREGIEDFELVGQLRDRQGGIDGDALTTALQVATRELDGRQKDPADLAAARALVVEERTR